MGNSGKGLLKLNFNVEIDVPSKYHVDIVWLKKKSQK